jgi:hypothetical protein
LIVARVAGGDARAIGVCSQSMQRAITQLARPCLEIRGALQPITEVGAHERNAAARRRRRGAALIAVTVCAAQAMVDVAHDQLDRQLPPQGG